jgi:hypothetical protein
VAEGGGLLNRYRLVKAYRGFESLRLRHPPASSSIASAILSQFDSETPTLVEQHAVARSQGDDDATPSRHQTHKPDAKEVRRCIVCVGFDRSLNFFDRRFVSARSIMDTSLSPWLCFCINKTEGGTGGMKQILLAAGNFFAGLLSIPRHTTSSVDRSCEPMA